MIDVRQPRRLASLLVLGMAACATSRGPESATNVSVGATTPRSIASAARASSAPAPAASASASEAWRASLPPVGSFACGETLCRAADEVCCRGAEERCLPKGTECSPRAECDESADCPNDGHCQKTDDAISCARSGAIGEEICVFGRPCPGGRRCVENGVCIPNRPPLPCGKETCTTAEAPYCLLDDGVLHCGGPGRSFYECFRDADCNAGEECCPGNVGQVSACRLRGDCRPDLGFDQMCRNDRDCVSLGKMLRTKLRCQEGPTPAIRFCR